MTSYACDFRDHLARQVTNFADPDHGLPQQAATNIVDINDRLPLHLDMVVSEFLAQAVEASRKAGASDHRIYKRMSEIAASVLDDPVRPKPSPDGPEEALHYFKILAPAFLDLGLTPAHMAAVLRYFAAAMAGEIEAKGMIEEAKARLLAKRTAESAWPKSARS